jgi:hypothetical protein
MGCGCGKSKSNKNAGTAVPPNKNYTRQAQQAQHAQYSQRNVPRPRVNRLRGKR